MDMQMQLRIPYFSFPCGLFYAVFCFSSEHVVKTIENNGSIIGEIIAALEWMCKGNIKFCIVTVVIAGILWLLDSALNVVLIYALFKVSNINFYFSNTYHK
jgi:hypothetical protein